ncbi:hypothetical protein F-VV10_0230 [Faustovirus]|nr:hypothetical protein F-VV10_0230 [Faustovirus]
MQNVYAINSTNATNNMNATINGAAAHMGADKISKVAGNAKTTNLDRVKTVIRNHRSELAAKLAPFQHVRRIISCDVNYPNVDVIIALRLIITSGIASQKLIAETVGLSQTKMSQYMNSSYRCKGWRDTDEKLLLYVNNYVYKIDGEMKIRNIHIEPLNSIESVCETPEEQLGAPTYNFGDAVHTFDESLYVEAPAKHTMQNVYQTQQATNDYWDYYTNAVDFNNDNFNWSG